jgi:hypothetical protein
MESDIASLLLEALLNTADITRGLKLPYQNEIVGRTSETTSGEEINKFVKAEQLLSYKYTSYIF